MFYKSFPTDYTSFKFKLYYSILLFHLQFIDQIEGKSIVILANYKFHFIRVHDNLVKDPSNNRSIHESLYSYKNVHCINNSYFQFQLSSKIVFYITILYQRLCKVLFFSNGLPKSYYRVFSKKRALKYLQNAHK